MHFAAFWKACLLGLSVAAPVGPIGILCIRRSLADGRAAGFATGLGAATADTLYALGAALGLSTLAGRAPAVLTWVGSGYLLYLGLRQWGPMRRGQSPPSSAAGWRAWASTLFLTLTNPMTILSFAAMFSAIGFSQSAWLSVVTGVFVGSTLWWLVLSTAASAFAGRLSAHLHWLNRASGGILIAFALAGAARALAS